MAAEDALLTASASPSPFLASRLGLVAKQHAEKRWPRFVGRAASMQRLEESITRVADFGCPVLITGETGCGKEEVARAIHAAGPRRGRPFVAVNCGELVSSLAESQLFGHEKGSFTGAVGASRGLFRAAEGGVVFLDEIGELPIELQPKLLRVLQRHEVTPVGSTDVQRVDVVVIAATHRNLEAEVAAGTFREDLLYRLNTIHLAVPPLRDRQADIPALVEFFAAHFARQYGRPQWRPEPHVLERLVGHAWPGNVRQLAQTIQRIYVFEDRVDDVLATLFASAAGPLAPPAAAVAADVPASVEMPPLASAAQPPAGAQSTADALTPPGDDEPRVPVFNLDELRRIAVRQALAATAGHRGKAAALLGVSLNTMTRLVTESCPELASPRAGRKRGVPAAKPR